MRKKHDRSFPDKAKEPVISRVFQLVDRYPSRSEAARAWGMNISTLQNYYKRKDISPTPRKAQLIKIAEQEGVSIDWLLTGAGKEPDFTAKKNYKNEFAQEVYPPTHMGSVDEKILELLSFLSENEKVKILEVLARKGIDTILYLLDEDNIQLLQLPSALKQQILIAHQANTEDMVNQRKVCASPEAEDSAQLDLTCKHKKVV